MTPTLVGKTDADEIVLLQEEDRVPVTKPLPGDVVEIGGIVWAYGENGRHNVTHKYLELTGQVIRQFTLEDYL